MPELAEQNPPTGYVSKDSGFFFYKDYDPDFSQTRPLPELAEQNPPTGYVSKDSGFFFYKDYDPDFSQNTITSSFGHAMSHKKVL